MAHKLRASKKQQYNVSETGSADDEIVRVIKSRRMRWAGHVARMGRGGERCLQGFGREARRQETTGKT
jgi:hypothetical protein